MSLLGDRSKSGGLVFTRSLGLGAIMGRRALIVVVEGIVIILLAVLMVGSTPFAVLGVAWIVAGGLMGVAEERARSRDRLNEGWGHPGHGDTASEALPSPSGWSFVPGERPVYLAVADKTRAVSIRRHRIFWIGMVAAALVLSITVAILLTPPPPSMSIDDLHGRYRARVSLDPAFGPAKATALEIREVTS